MPVLQPPAGAGFVDAAPDAEIVARVLEGDLPRFEVLMRRHNQRLFRAARAVLRDDAEAEDVLQQAYLQAYAHLRQWDGRAQFSTWLTRIALHEALHRARRRRLRPQVALPGDEAPAVKALEEPRPDPEAAAHASGVRTLLEAAIDALPRHYRSVFVLREVEELSTRETADCLELNEDVVKTRLRRARAMLREELLQRAGTAGASAFAFHRERCDRVVFGVLGRLAGEASGAPDAGGSGARLPQA
jgi:RNA polymerase sigma-70 factor (ECF subfamily)